MNVVKLYLMMQQSVQILFNDLGNPVESHNSELPVFGENVSFGLRMSNIVSCGVLLYVSYVELSCSALSLIHVTTSCRRRNGCRVL